MTNSTSADATVCSLPPLALRAQVADYLQVSAQCMARWAVEGTGPKFIKMGHSKNAPVRYRSEDVLAWVAGLEGEQDEAMWERAAQRELGVGSERVAWEDATS